jgi:hypothetical protein
MNDDPVRLGFRPNKVLIAAPVITFSVIVTISQKERRHSSIWHLRGDGSVLLRGGVGRLIAVYGLVDVAYLCISSIFRRFIDVGA